MTLKISEKLLAQVWPLKMDGFKSNSEIDNEIGDQRKNKAKESLAENILPERELMNRIYGSE